MGTPQPVLHTAQNLPGAQNHPSTAPGSGQDGVSKNMNLDKFILTAIDELNATINALSPAAPSAQPSPTTTPALGGGQTGTPTMVDAQVPLGGSTDPTAGKAKFHATLTKALSDIESAVGAIRKLFQPMTAAAPAQTPTLPVTGGYAGMPSIIPVATPPISTTPVLTANAGGSSAHLH